MRTLVVLMAIAAVFPHQRGYSPVTASHRICSKMAGHGLVAFRNIYIRPLRPLIVR